MKHHSFMANSDPFWVWYTSVVVVCCVVARLVIIIQSVRIARVVGPLVVFLPLLYIDLDSCSTITVR
jgi:hypothetical protein